MYALNDLWTNMCGIFSRRGMCFWDCRSCMCNEVWKVWGGQSIRTTLKEFWGCEGGFAPHRTRGYRRPHALFATLGAAALSHTYRSQCGFHGFVAAFTHCPLFHFVPCKSSKFLEKSWHITNQFCNFTLLHSYINSVYMYRKYTEFVKFYPYL